MKLARVIYTETVAGKGWDGDDIVDVMDDLGSLFRPGEKVVVIDQAEYERLKAKAVADK